MENKQINNPSRSELITDFVKSNPEYYIKEFQKIGMAESVLTICACDINKNGVARQ